MPFTRKKKSTQPTGEVQKTVIATVSKKRGRPSRKTQQEPEFVMPDEVLIETQPSPSIDCYQSNSESEDYPSPKGPETSGDSSVRKKEMELISQQAKKGRQKGALAYSSGDKEAVLESTHFILPGNENEWKKVEDHYNNTYANR